LRTSRAQILEWAEQGALPPDNVDAAFAAAGVTPGAADWQRFISSLLLWLGAVLVAAGVIFFFAYNWDAMGRFAKFGLIEAVLVMTVVAALVAGPDTAAGKASLLLAALLTGGLLALIGQTYQTGADPYELFAIWALLILPWTFVSRLPAFWLLLLLLLNLAVTLYFQAFRGLFGFLFTSGSVVWALALLNAAALVLWEFAASRGISWLRERWAARLVSAASGISVTALTLWAIVDSSDVGPLAFLAYVAWLAGAYYYYRHRVRDLFVLAGGVLSVIVTVTTLLSREILRGGDAGGFLIIGIVVVVMSAAGAWWLKSIAATSEDVE